VAAVSTARKHLQGGGGSGRPKNLQEDSSVMKKLLEAF
jgi:hypothetical protein